MLSTHNHRVSCKWSVAAPTEWSTESRDNCQWKPGRKSCGKNIINEIFCHKFSGLMEILASLSSTQQKWGRLDMMEFVELTRLIHTYTELRARDNNKVAFVTRSPNLSCFSYLFWLESWLTLIVLYHFELANKPRIDFVSHRCFLAFCIKLAT